ncbi:hypothetical protein L1887_42567 [Cichorium endivia]|nr:hypothetical protein L1887_42567 [Cichorium endivia]
MEPGGEWLASLVARLVRRLPVRVVRRGGAAHKAVVKTRPTQRACLRAWCACVVFRRDGRTASRLVVVEGLANADGSNGGKAAGEKAGREEGTNGDRAKLAGWAGLGWARRSGADEAGWLSSPIVSVVVSAGWREDRGLGGRGEGERVSERGKPNLAGSTERASKRARMARQARERGREWKGERGRREASDSHTSNSQAPNSSPVDERMQKHGSLDGSRNQQRSRRCSCTTSYSNATATATANAHAQPTHRPTPKKRCTTQGPACLPACLPALCLKFFRSKFKNKKRSRCTVREVCGVLKRRRRDARSEATTGLRKKKGARLAPLSCIIDSSPSLCRSSWAYLPP